MKKRIYSQSSEGQFGLSTGDLMAALLLIFVLLLIGTILKLQEEFETKSKIAENYRALQVELYDDLMREFEEDLDRWDAEIDSSLTIRFLEPKVLFAAGSAALSSEFAVILNNFFPRYISILSSDKYIEHIEEIRVEGHTSSEGTVGMSEANAYFYNMRLSQDRTRSVLEHSLASVGPQAFEWTRDRATANGLSSSKRLVLNELTEEDREVNRRVEFRVKTDAEAQLREMLRYADDQ